MYAAGNPRAGTYKTVTAIGKDRKIIYFDRSCVFLFTHPLPLASAITPSCRGDDVMQTPVP